MGSGAGSSAPSAGSGLTLKDTARAAGRIWRQQGLGGFYRAYGPHLGAEVLGRGYYYACYGALKLVLAKYLGSHGRLQPVKGAAGGGAGRSSGGDRFSSGDPERDVGRLPLWARVLAGSMTGVSSWAFVYPIEVVKTRIQSGMYSSVRHCVSSSLRKEGIGVFYRGLGVAMMRAAPTAAVTLSLFDVLQGQGLKVAGIGG